MVCEPREIGASPDRRRQRAERAARELHAAMRRERLLDHDAGDLVPEADGVALGAQHARRETRVEPDGLAAEQRLEQPQLGARRLDRDGVEQRARVVVEPRRAGQHGVAHGLGDLAAARPRAPR